MTDDDIRKNYISTEKRIRGVPRKRNAVEECMNMKPPNLCRMKLTERNYMEQSPSTEADNRSDSKISHHSRRVFTKDCLKTHPEPDEISPRLLFSLFRFSDTRLCTHIIHSLKYGPTRNIVNVFSSHLHVVYWLAVTYNCNV
jgi:hypothetical protein